MTHAQLLPLAVASPILAWSFYRRFRRNIGRQKFRPARTLLSTAILLFALTMIAAAVHQAGASTWPLACGLPAGALLGLFGHRLTRFETLADGKFYTPNPWLGTTLSLLLVARVLYRFAVITLGTGQAQSLQPAMNQSTPLTLGLFGLTVGYYLVYNLSVFLSFRPAAAPSAETP